MPDVDILRRSRPRLRLRQADDDSRIVKALTEEGVISHAYRDQC
jgi:uncharacterized protein YutE (UPF0331/DUF86 family)